MRILVVTTTLPRFISDPEPRFVLDLCNAMARQHSVTILAPGDPEATGREQLEGAEIVRFRYFPLRQFERLAYPGGIIQKLEENKSYWLLVPPLILGMMIALIRETRKRRYDVIHCHWIIPQGAVCSLLRLMPGFPRYMITSHGVDIVKARRGWPFRGLCTMALRGAYAVTAVSKQIADEIERLPGIDHNVPHIPMGVDTRHFAGDRSPLPEILSQLGTTYVIFVGRLCEKKGLIYLLRAFASKPLAERAVHLVIAGDGPDRQLIENEIRRLRLGSKIVMLGALPHEKLVTVLRAASICCIPSIVADNGDREGTPTVLFEAFAAGTAVLASRSGGIPEVVADEFNGLLVNEKDIYGIAAACQRLLIDADLRQRLASNALESVGQFDWNCIASRHLEKLESVVTASDSCR